MTVQMQQVNLTAGQIVADRYAIERELGKGGMGRVYLAHQRPFDRPVVIKIMHPKYLADDNLRQRFFNEARAASQLSHPNSITVFDFGKTEDEIYFIAMEYVDGVTLRKALSNSGPMPLERAVPIVLQVAQSLGEAHRKSIIHRDLKPENIMLGRPGTTDEFVKVLDFGIAKVMDNQTGITQTGSVFGTPGYMAPEQGRAEEIDQTVDLYSLTCCFYELLTGKMPFGGESALQVMMKHQSDPVPPLPDGFPPALDTFMRQGLAKTAEERPQTADDYVTALLGSLREAEADLRGTPRNGAERPSSGQFVRGTPSPADRSSGNLEATSGSIPSPAQIRAGGARSGSGTNPSPPPNNLEIPSPSDASAETQKATARVDSSPLREGLGHADTRPSRDSDQLRTPGGTPRYASPAPAQPSGAPVAPTDSGQQPSGIPQASPSNPPSADSVPRGSSPYDSSPAQPAPPQRQSSPQVAQHTPGQQAAPPPQNTDTWPQEHGSNGAKYWAIAATVVSGILAALVIMMSWNAGQSGPQVSGVASTNAPANRSVQVNSEPQKALVVIDGKEVGVTPTDYSAKPGETLDIKLSRPGYQTRSLQHTVSADSGEQRVFAALEPRSLELSVASPVDGAEVEINGESYGKLPANRAKDIELEWPEEDLNVVIKHPDYEDFVARVPASSLDSTESIRPTRSDLVPRADDG